MTRWTSADLNRKPAPQKTLTVNSRTPRQATTPPEPPACREDKKTRLKHPLTPTSLKPRYQVATTDAYEGRKFVAVGLTQEQADQLAAAAQGLGIQQQN